MSFLNINVNDKAQIQLVWQVSGSLATWILPRNCMFEENPTHTHKPGPVCKNEPKIHKFNTYSVILENIFNIDRKLSDLCCFEIDGLLGGVLSGPSRGVPTPSCGRWLLGWLHFHISGPRSTRFTYRFQSLLCFPLRWFFLKMHVHLLAFETMKCMHTL